MALLSLFFKAVSYIWSNQRVQRKMKTNEKATLCLTPKMLITTEKSITRYSYCNLKVNLWLACMKTVWVQCSVAGAKLRQAESSFLGLFCSERAVTLGSWPERYSWNASGVLMLFSNVVIICYRLYLPQEMGKNPKSSKHTMLWPWTV